MVVLATQFYEEPRPRETSKQIGRVVLYIERYNNNRFLFLHLKIGLKKWNKKIIPKIKKNGSYFFL